MAEFCYPNAPEDLKRAVRDIEHTQQWTKGKTLDELLVAHDLIYVHHHVPRAIIQEAIAAKRHQQLDEHFTALRQPHPTVVPNFRATVIAAGASVLALIVGILAWLFPRLQDASSSSPPTVPAAVAPTLPSTQPAAAQATPLPSPPSVVQPPATPASVPARVAPASSPAPPATPAPKQP